MSFKKAVTVLVLLASIFCNKSTFSSFVSQELPVFVSDKCQEEAPDATQVLVTVAEMLSSDKPATSAYPLSCLEVRKSSPSSPSGYYPLSDGSGNANIVYCNMDDLYSCPSLEQTLQQLMFQQESLSLSQELIVSSQLAMNQSLAGIAVTGAATETLAQQMANSQAQINETTNSILETTTATNSLTQQVASDHKNLQQTLNTAASLLSNATDHIGTIHEISYSTNSTLAEVTSLANEIAGSQKMTLYLANKTDQEMGQVLELANQTLIVQEAIEKDTMSLVSQVADIKSASEQIAGDITSMDESLVQITEKLASVSGVITALKSLMEDMAAEQTATMQLLNSVVTTTSSTSDALHTVQQQVQSIVNTQKSVEQSINGIVSASTTTNSDLSQVKTVVMELAANQDVIIESIESVAATCNSGAKSIILNTEYTHFLFVVLAATCTCMLLVGRIN